MRVEKDFLGEVSIPGDALYGIHSYRARLNFPSGDAFHEEWYRAVGRVKSSCYKTIQKFKDAARKEYPDTLDTLKLPSDDVLSAMVASAEKVAEGNYFDAFIVPALQGGAGTSINMNINEIIANASLQEMGHAPGEYHIVDPIEDANVYQSTNDVIPTALTVAAMQLLTSLEHKINDTRMQVEHLETAYRNSLRLAYTQMQEAVPSTYGQLFSTYSEALSRDWWRVSKTFERIKVVNLGGGATGSGISLPRFYIMSVVSQLKKDTKLPITQGENLADATANMDRFVEVHAILKAHAVNLEKMVSDLRLLSSGTAKEKEIYIPQKQVGSSIMPGKVNPVIPEFIISGAHQIYANDQLITAMSAQGCLDLNAYLPSIGHALIQSLKLLIHMNESVRHHLLEGLTVHEEAAKNKVYRSPSISTLLSPLIGYNRASELAKYMGKYGKDIFEANTELEILSRNELEKILSPEYLVQKGFSLKDIRNIKPE